MSLWAFSHLHFIPTTGIFRPLLTLSKFSSYVPGHVPFLALCHIQLCFHSSLVLTIRPKSIFPCPLLSLACPLSIMCQLRHSITLDFSLFFSFSTPINYICIIPFSFKSILSCDPSGVLSYTIVFHIKDMRQISNWFTPSSQLKGNKNPPFIMCQSKCVVLQ